MDSNDNESVLGLQFINHKTIKIIMTEASIRHLGRKAGKKEDNSLCLSQFRSKTDGTHAYKIMQKMRSEGLLNKSSLKRCNNQSVFFKRHGLQVTTPCPLSLQQQGDNNNDKRNCGGRGGNKGAMQTKERPMMSMCFFVPLTSANTTSSTPMMATIAVDARGKIHGHPHRNDKPVMMMMGVTVEGGGVYGQGK